MPPLLGQISLFPYSFAPMGWMFCDGSLIAIGEAEALFQLIGNTYGGDGESTFAVPNLTAIAPPNCNYCIAIVGSFTTNFYEGIIGETVPLPTASQPAQNLVKCAGQSFTKNQYPFLQIYIGNRFGGDGVNTFNLPNLSSSPLINGYDYLITVQGSDPNSPTARDPFLGQLILLPYSQTFQSLLLCNGSQLPVQQNTALYSVIGNRFGGNTEQFSLPDLRNAVPANYSYYICTTGVFPRSG
jgi:microcystin-dependent protein